MIHPHIHIRLRLDERHRDTPPVILWRPKPGRPRHYHSPQLHMLGAWAHTRRSATMTPRPAKKRRGVTATSPRPIASRAAAFPTCAGGGRCSGSAVRVKVRRGYLRNGLAMTVEQVKGFACRTAWTEAASPWYGVVGRPPLGMGWMGTCAITPSGATGGALRLLDRQRDAVSHFLTDRGATAARIARHSTRRRVSGFPTCAIWGRGSGSAAHLRLREFPLWHCHW